MRNEFRESLEGLFRSLFLNESDCRRARKQTKISFHYSFSSSSSIYATLRALTCQNNRHGNRNTDRVVLVPNQQTDDRAAQQQQDQRVLVDLLEELEEDVLGSCDLELVRTVG